MEKENINIFSENVAVYKINYNEKKLKNYVNNLIFKETFHTKDSDKIESNCFISKKENILNDLPILKKQIITCVNDHLNNTYEYNIDYFQITDSWCTKTKQNGYSHEHFHCHSLLSGVFYLNKASIRITKPTIDTFWNISIRKNNLLNSKYIDFNVNNGSLILFKSYLNHKIMQHKDKEDRYSIAFNVIPKGKFGDSTSRIYFGNKNNE